MLNYLSYALLFFLFSTLGFARTSTSSEVASSNPTQLSAPIGSSAPLSGIYTLGKSGGADFHSFKELEDTLQALGIAGPTVININPGEYYGQLSLIDISGLSATNTLIIQGTGKVTVTHNDSLRDNYVFALSGSPYVTFKNMSLILKATSSVNGGGFASRGIIEIIDGSNFTTIDNCILTNLGPVTIGIFLPNGGTTVRNGQQITLGKSHSVTVKNCTIEHVETAIKVQMPKDSSASRGHNIMDNTIAGFGTGIEMHFANNVKVSGNYIVQKSQLYGSEGVIVIGDTVTISGNTIKTRTQQLVSNTKSPNPLVQNKIYNNVIVSPLGNALGFPFNSTVYIGSYTDFIHNTVVGHRCLSLFSSENTNIFNNIFDTGDIITSTQCIYSPYPLHTSAAIDYNLYYNNGSGAIAIFNANGSMPRIYPTLANWQNFSLLNTNSLHGDPKISSSKNEYRSFGLLANNSGDGLSSLATDKLGNMRPATNVDIGAYEFDTSAYDLRVLEILDLPNAICSDSSKMVRAVIQNIGLQSISNFSVHVNLSGPIASSGTKAFTQNLLQLQIDTFLLPKLNTYAAGNYGLEVIVQHQSDYNGSNDSLSINFSVSPTSPPLLQRDTNLICSTLFFDTLRLHSKSNNHYQYWSTVSDSFLSDKLVTPVGPLNTSDTVFKLNTLGNRIYRVGPKDASFGQSGYLSVNNSLGINFKIFEKCTIDSFDVYPSEASISLNINLRNSSGDLIETKTFNIVKPSNNKPVSVPVNFRVEPGNYTIDSHGSSPLPVSLLRNSAGASYPYYGGDLVTIMSSTSSSANGYYYFYYNWHVSKYVGCALPPVLYTIKRTDDSTSAKFTANPTLTPLEVVFNASSSYNANTYSWDFGDGTSDSGRVVSHVYPVAGQYNATLITYLPCNSTILSDTVSHNVEPLSINSQTFPSVLKIYPNPTSGQFTVERESFKEELVIQIFDLSGANLEQFTMRNGEKSTLIDLSHFRSGVYLIEISTNDYLFYHKLMKI